MTRANRLALPLGIVAAWAAAGSTLPLAITAPIGALCVLVLPGLCVERALSGTVAPHGAAAAAARWITLSTALIAIAGLVASTTGGDIHGLLLAIAVASTALAVLPARPRSRTPETVAGGTAVDPDERIARAALLAIVGVAVVLAAASPNVARDRMWYLAFVTQLSGGAPIDWTEPFLGTGAIAARFAYNGWLLALAAWSSLTGAAPSLVFERLAPPLLTIAAASAAWHFGARTVPGRPGLAALASLAAMLATRFPFFSPERYPFFARIAEDKSTALLVFAPVALVAVADASDTERRSSVATWASLALALIAVAFGHGLVLFFVGIVIAFLLASACAGGEETSARRVLGALVLAAAVAAVPGRMAMLARDRIVDIEEPAEAWSEDGTHPVVRAHLRLERTRELPLGGPIVEPTLVADPLLLAGIAGIVVAWRQRRRAGPALLAASSVPFVALAFVPFLAPSFGRIVLPWMAYRALWMIPFGSLLALLLAALQRSPLSTVARGGVALLLVATTLAALPWGRANARPDIVSPLRDGDTRELLARIAALPTASRIAAAPGFAELVPALAGRAVLAFADRGTFVFAGSRAAAEERLRASAAIVALAPGSSRLRRAEAARHGVTHFVLADRRCGRAGREVYRSGPLRLCEVHADAGEAASVMVVAPPSDLASSASRSRFPRAALGAGITCAPAAERERAAHEADIHRWKRASRWTAKPVVIRCKAKLVPPSSGNLSLTFAAELPRARESIVLRAVMRTVDRRKVTRHAAVALEGRRTSTLALSSEPVRAIRLRVAPAYLPYLSLRELSLWEQRGVGE